MMNTSTQRLPRDASPAKARLQIRPPRAQRVYRVTVLVQIDGQIVRCKSKSISTATIKVSLPRAIASGSDVKLAFVAVLDGHLHSVHSPARTLYSSLADGAFSTTFEFDEPSAATKLLLERIERSL